MIQIFLHSTPLGSNLKQTKKQGDKWYKVIEQSADDCCSDLDENELTDEDDLNNNNVNNQSLLSSSKSVETVDVSHTNCVRDFFDCLRFRRNYKRNRKKYGKGQSGCQTDKQKNLYSFSHHHPQKKKYEKKLIRPPIGGLREKKIISIFFSPFIHPNSMYQIQEEMIINPRVRQMNLPYGHI